MNFDPLFHRVACALKKDILSPHFLRIDHVSDVRKSGGNFEFIYTYLFYVIIDKTSSATSVKHNCKFIPPTYILGFPST